MGELIQLTVSGKSMDTYVSRPETSPTAAILVCMHGPGVDEFIRDICKRLSSLGYLAIAPNFYHRLASGVDEPWMKMVDTEAIEDMRAAIDFLAATGTSKIGIVGFCMGGRLAYLDLAHDERIRTGVIFHGGNIMMQKDEVLCSPLEQSESISAPILGIFGADDSNPSPADMEQISAHLESLGKAHEFESFAGAGHAFLNFTRPHMFREQQAALAWQRCVDWLEAQLG